MYPGLVSEGAVTPGDIGKLWSGSCLKNIRNGVHEGNVDLHSLGDQVFYFTEHSQVILGLDIFRVGSIETSDETPKGSDAHTLTNS